MQNAGHFNRHVARAHDPHAFGLRLEVEEAVAGDCERAAGQGAGRGMAAACDQDVGGGGKQRAAAAAGGGGGGGGEHLDCVSVDEAREASDVREVWDGVAVAAPRLEALVDVCQGR